MGVKRKRFVFRPGHFACSYVGSRCCPARYQVNSRPEPPSVSGLLVCMSSGCAADASFFFPSMLIGPSLDYATYNSLITHTIYSTPPPGTGVEQAKATKRRIPYGRKRVAYLHLALGLSFLGFYAVYGGRGSYTRILGEDWSKWSLLTRFGFVQFAAFVAKSKYYAVWSMSEVGRAKAALIPGRVYPHRGGVQRLRPKDRTNTLE